MPGVVCTVPTPDGNPSVGHPDVVDFGEEWNGYRYWMAFTPYPNSVRENPCLVASNDRTTWVVPAGITNPIAPRESVDQSDTDMLMLGTDLAVFYRENAPVKLFRRLISDTLVVGDRAECTAASDGSSLTGVRSPALVLDGSTLKMWYTSGSAGSYSVKYREAADGDVGLSWGAEQSVTFPKALTPWHVDVVKVGSTFHMLLATREPWRIQHFTSADGLTFTGDPSPALQVSGESWDERGHYRGSLTVASTDPLTFNVWATGIDGSGADVFAADWRIAHWPAISLPEQPDIANFATVGL